MAKVCQLTGRRPLSGNKVSHAHNKTRRRFLPNLHSHRYWVPSKNQFITLRLSAAAMRTVDKLGIEAVIQKLKEKGEI